MSSPPHSLILVPTSEQLENALARFQADWGLIDEVLYGLCRQYPDHGDRRAVCAKLAMIGRVYAAGLERRVTPPAGQQAIGVITNFVVERAIEVDQIISRLQPLHEPMTADAMSAVVEEHGKLTSLLREVATDGKAPRSFASKYLHFHNPVVPIFDEYARQGITRLVRWDGRYLPFDFPPHGDREYWDYAVRFFRLYDACHEARIPATVKSLDAFLWSVPVSVAGAAD